MKTRLDQVAFDPELVPGAQNAIKVCLRIREGEKVTLIADRATSEIAACLYAECKLAGAQVADFILEDYAVRPLVSTPRAILASVAGSAATLYAVRPQPGEIVTRAQIINLVTRRKIRYGHMVGITREIMTQGMRADFGHINRLSLRLRSLLSECRVIRVTSPAGTDLEIEHDPLRYRWIKTSGLISRDAWGNLPGGEIFTHPSLVRGIWFCDGPVGDYFSHKYGDLKETPLKVEIANSRIKSASCDRPDVASEFWDYVQEAENANRVGEVAVGTNLNVKEFTGNLLQDEKIPGFHIAFGEPCGVLTGADWTSPTHIDLLARYCNIWLDGQCIMANGQFLV
ncbi:MAG: aminopeptidase [Cyanobacteria bacterium NC_groundwater_1444_Ag_S-0.65um_54_12]|nr:aminopeptidase [Cyanobacteria bacterium NC_groundwater_1444_Ag_S-0.65um_54_12]